jgi:hypothetical protein
MAEVERVRELRDVARDEVAVPAIAVAGEDEGAAADPLLRPSGRVAVRPVMRSSSRGGR